MQFREAGEAVGDQVVNLGLPSKGRKKIPACREGRCSAPNACWKSTCYGDCTMTSGQKLLEADPGWALKPLTSSVHLSTL